MTKERFSGEKRLAFMQKVDNNSWPTPNHNETPRKCPICTIDGR
jgi:hypothetical protein